MRAKVMKVTARTVVVTSLVVAVTLVATPASAADGAPALAAAGQSVPWIAALVAVLLVGGGALFWWLSARRRRAAAGPAAEPDADELGPGV